MEKKTLVLGSFVLMLGLLGGIAAKQTLFNRGAYVEKYADGRVIPITGLLVNPHGLDNLVNDVEEDFRKLYVAMTDYARSTGRLPDDPRELIAFTSRRTNEWRITEEAFYSPDYKKSDVYSPLDEKFSYMWAYRSPRADGKAKPAFPVVGERDVWLSTETYVREGKRVYRNGSYTSLPQGYYLVMWSDGTIEKIGLDKRLQARSGERGLGFFFEGEAGATNDMVPSGEGKASKGKWWPLPGSEASSPDLSVGR